jgi:hypothetical protein
MLAVESYPQILLAPADKDPPGGSYQSPHLYYGNDSRVYFVYALFFFVRLAIFLDFNNFI